MRSGGLCNNWCYMRHRQVRIECYSFDLEHSSGRRVNGDAYAFMWGELNFSYHLGHCCKQIISIIVNYLMM